MSGPARRLAERDLAVQLRVVAPPEEPVPQADREGQEVWDSHDAPALPVPLAPGVHEPSRASSHNDTSTNDTSTAVSGRNSVQPPLPEPELLEELARGSQELENASAREILRWAYDRYPGRFTMATAFGPEGMCLIHMAAEVAPGTHVFNLDTGYQFPETLEMFERVRRRYGLQVQRCTPELSVQEYEQLHGGPVYASDPNRCCADRKLAVLRRAIAGMSAWASAIRRDQSVDRSRAPIVGWDAKFGLVKVSPLANWTKKDVWKLISEHDIPYNPLHDQGYTSIGCWPCTRAVLFGEDERAGRWSGSAKTECGLHTPDDGSSSSS